MPASFRIIIVGGGIAGLAAAIGLQRKGHQVTVLERSPGCQTLGGQIFLPACATRILIDEYVFYRRYENGKLLAAFEAQDHMDTFGYPLWGFARFNLQKTLLDFAQAHGIEVVFNSTVKSANQSIPSILLDDGREFKADIIIGADGVHSVIRDTVLAGQQPHFGKDTCYYSLSSSRSLLSKDPQLASLLEGTTFWWGPRRSVMIGNMPQHNDTFSILLNSEQTAGIVTDWYEKGDLEAVKAEYTDFDPRITKILDQVSSERCYLWRIRSIDSLPTWVSPSSKMILMGDAAHALRPAGGTGAALSIEDGACLAECLDKANSLTDLPSVIHAYEILRKPRAEFAVARATALGATFLLPDGPEQTQRDASWARFYAKQNSGWNGKHIDDPPKLSANGVSEWYLKAFDVISHTKRHINNILRNSVDSKNRLKAVL